MLPIEWICRQFEIGRFISERDLHDALDDSMSQQVLLTLNYLVTQNIASKSTKRGHAGFCIQNMPALRQLLQDSQIEPSPCDESLVPDASEPAPGTEHSQVVTTEVLVVSAPLSMVGKLRSLQAQYERLPTEGMKDAFSRLLASAQSEVLLSVPFLELDGLIAFIDEIKRLGERQVSIKALTREFLSPSQTNYGYYQKLRAFSKLIDVYVSSGGNPEQVQVRDYTVKIGRAGDRGLVYEGIHQKMIVIDRARAYIGSGEIRAPSFIVNGDVGVIQSGQAAQFWADYFMLFWSEALQVDHQFFRSAQS